jgi:uncharacterized protein YciI
LIVAVAAVLLIGSAWGQQTPVAPSALPLFAIELTVGPKWDAAKPPQDQPFFREHSANLARLREAGSVVIGARYADKGLVVVAAPTIEAAQAMMDGDPSIAAGTFVFDVHPFNVFYGGTIEPRPR